MKKFFCLLLMCLFALPMLSSCTSGGKTRRENESYALFLYMSGNDLESGSGAASRTISQILSAPSHENVDVYVMTGGASQWKQHDIPSDEAVIYSVQEEELSAVRRLPSANMGDASVLKEFLALAEKTEADRKVLLFWGHGSPYGICPDQLHGNDMLTYGELSDALSENLFDLIVFNACYTANLDLMTYICRSADYAIASEEVLPSIGFDYSAMLALLNDNGGADIADIGKRIIDDTLLSYGNSTLKDSLTLSLIDLRAVARYRADFSSVFNEWLYQTNDLLRSVAKTNSIGKIGKDLFDLAEHCGLEDDSFAKMLRNIVLYEIHGTRFDTSGLYLYFGDGVTAYDIRAYQENCAYSDYYTFMHNVMRLKEGQYLDFISSSYDGNGIYNAVLDELSPIYSAFFGYTLYDAEGGIIKMDGLCVSSRFNDINQYTYLTVPEDVLFSLKMGNIELDHVLLTVQEEEISRESRNIYAAPLLVNGELAFLYFSYDYTYDFDDPHYFGQLDGSYSILGYVYENDGQAYMIEELKAGDVIEYGGERLIYGNESIERTSIPEGGYIALTVEDIYGNLYNTPLYPIGA